MADDLSIPDFIPDEMQHSYLRDAHRTVVASDAPTRPSRRPTRTLGAARGASGGSTRVAVVATAATLAVLGLFALSLMWTWLAMTDGAMWIPFAVGGWTATVALPGVLVGAWWHRFGRHTHA